MCSSQETASVTDTVTLQSRKDDGSDVKAQVVTSSTGFFTGAQNLAVTGGQFLEVHGNYTVNVVNNTQVDLTDDKTPLPPQKHSSIMFTGRDLYLNRLKGHFCSNDAAGRKAFLLYGMGGIGKTQICLKFVEKHGTLFSDIFWIDASSESSIDLRLRQIAKANDAAPGTTSSAASALNWIAGKTNWLMIYDNADGGYQVVEKFLPPGDDGNVLITSRNKDLMRITLKENSMEVLEMEEEEALPLLAKSAMVDYTSADVKDLAKQLISKLGGIPLAIDQAGAYMMACNYSLEDYLELFIKHQNQLMSDPSFKGASDYGSSTYGTWEISIKEIEARASNKEDPRAMAAESAIILHRIFAFLHHENIPEELFKNAAQNYKETDINANKELGLPLLVTVLDAKTLFLNERGEWNKIQLQAGIRVLLSFSLIRSSGKMYSIHPLVHSWSRDIIPKTEIGNQHLIARALLSCSIGLDYHSDDYEFWGILLPHIRANNEYAQELQLKIPYYDDECARFALVLNYIGSWDEAEVLQMCMVEERKGKLGPDHIHTLTSMKDLSLTYWDQGRWKEVEKLQMQVMEVSTEKFGAEAQLTLDSLSILSVAYKRQGRLDESEKLEVQIMETHKANLGLGHPSTLASMANLAVTYIHQDKLVEAEKLLLHVMEAKRATLGPNHYRTLMTMSNLAMTYLNQGKWEDAEKLYLHVLEASKAKFGPNHPETFIGMGNLGSTYRCQGRMDEAQVLLSQALISMEQIIGPDHPTTLWLRWEVDELIDAEYRIEE